MRKFPLGNMKTTGSDQTLVPDLRQRMAAVERRVARIEREAQAAAGYFLSGSFLNGG
jgi:hypothetical protein